MISPPSPSSPEACRAGGWREEEGATSAKPPVCAPVILRAHSGKGIITSGAGSRTAPVLTAGSRPVRDPAPAAVIPVDAPRSRDPPRSRDLPAEFSPTERPAGLLDWLAGAAARLIAADCG